MSKIDFDRHAGFACLRGLLAILGLVFISACSDNNNNASEPLPETPAPVEAAVAPFQELLDQGIDRYLGLYSPMSSSETNGVVNYAFGEGDGPLCLEGAPYTMATRDQGSEDLVIYLQGGGACWFDFCAATSVAETGILKIGLLDPESASNPVADWNTVYMPYCDGGLHVSDSDVDTDGDGSNDRFHRGLHNTSAALDVAVQAFPAPRRILLVGVSGGGYGTVFALPLVRHLYPDVPIEVLNDSGVGINRPEDEDWNNQVLDYWNIAAFFPESSGELISAGNPTDYFDWQLQEDANFTLALLSHKQDFTIGSFFLGIGGPAFEAVLLQLVDALESLHPERVRSFIRNGTEHTFLADLSLSAAGVTLSDWLTSMLENPDSWESVADE